MSKRTAKTSYQINKNEFSVSPWVYKDKRWIILKLEKAIDILKLYDGMCVTDEWGRVINPAGDFLEEVKDVIGENNVQYYEQKRRFRSK